MSGNKPEKHPILAKHFALSPAISNETFGAPSMRESRQKQNYYTTRPRNLSIVVTTGFCEIFENIFGSK